MYQIRSQILTTTLQEAISSILQIRRYEQKCPRDAEKSKEQTQVGLTRYQWFAITQQMDAIIYLTISHLVIHLDGTFFPHCKQHCDEVF